MRRPLYERWIEKVEKTETCWLWRGAIKETGYGVINAGDGRTMRAHRFAYEHFIGAIPAGLDIRHSCHNRICVNPAHLSIGTRTENMRDMIEAGRSPKGRKLGLRGESNGMAKLTDEQAEAIRADPRSGRAIAAAHGISPSLVSYIRSGHRQRAHAMPRR